MSDIQRKTINAADVATLNSVGLSLQDIAARLGCHHTTVAQKLRCLGVSPMDTRRAFMSDIWEQLTPEQRRHVVSRLGPTHSIKDLVRSLIVKDYLDNN